MFHPSGAPVSHQFRHFLGVSGVRFYISGPLSPGEGELKLADWLNTATGSAGRNAHKGAALAWERPFVEPCESAVVVGGDADLVVQALALPSTPNLFVYSPNSPSGTKSHRCKPPKFRVHLLCSETDMH